MINFSLLLFIIFYLISALVKNNLENIWHFKEGMFFFYGIFKLLTIPFLTDVIKYINVSKEFWLILFYVAKIFMFCLNKLKCIFFYFL